MIAHHIDHARLGFVRIMEIGIGVAKPGVRWRSVSATSRFI